jgi:hypothetical protein
VIKSIGRGVLDTRLRGYDGGGYAAHSAVMRGAPGNDGTN